jgi:hypothetical protein
LKKDYYAIILTLTMEHPPRNHNRKEFLYREVLADVITPMGNKAFEMLLGKVGTEQ